MAIKIQPRFGIEVSSSIGIGLVQRASRTYNIPEAIVAICLDNGAVCINEAGDAP